MRQLFHYTAFGLAISSEIELPGVKLALGHVDPQVVVQLGEVPTQIADAEARGDWFEARHDMCLLRIPQVGRYLIRDGREITVDPLERASPTDIRLVLMGSAFGAVLKQRGLLTLHASAIRVNDVCVAVAGSSGMGKSTMVAWLNRRGYEIVCDDVCAVQLDGHAMVPPGFTRIKLWEDALAALDIPIDGLVNILHHNGRQKYETNLQFNYAGTPLPLRRLYVLNASGPASSNTIQTVTGTARFSSVMANTYRPEYLDGLTLRADFFRQCSDVLKSVTILSLPRATGFEQMDATLDRFEQHLKTLPSP